jgi:hypothetical protein
MTIADQDYGSHRRRGDTRRGPAHAKTSPRWPDGGTGPFAAQGTFEAAPPRGVDPRFGRQDQRWPDAPPPGYQDAGSPAYQADYYQAENPGWTQPPGYQAGYPDHPGWDGRQQPEYPEWTGQQQRAEYPEWTEPPAYQTEYQGWTQPPRQRVEYPGWTGQPGYQGEYGGQPRQPAQGDYPDYPDQPAVFGQYALHPDHPSWPESQFAPWPGEAPRAGGRQSGVAAGPPLPNRVRPPAAPQPDFPPRGDAAPHTLAPRRDLPLHRDMDFYPAPMSETITDVASWGQPDVGYAQPAREQIWDTGSSQLADWIIADANQQAAEITREARDRATSSLADAQQEAAEIVRRTGEQAALTIEAAELQAAEIRATMMKLTTELTGMAAYVTQSLGPAPASAPSTPAPTAFSASAAAPTAPKPTGRPPTDRAARAVATPAAESAGQPTAAAPAGPAGGSRARTATAPGVRPARQPAAMPTARPGAKPNGKSRQHAAVRAMTIFTAAMVVFALTAGASEVALHGFKFFVFRSTGTGETGPNGGQEDQGPGQPNAPGVHQQAQ